jgi:hypothetical protein
MLYITDPSQIVAKPIPPLKAGQLWLWDFSFTTKKADKDEGWWLAMRVTDEGRNCYSNAAIQLKRGDVFTVVTVDDPGPYRLLTAPIHFNDGWETYPAPRYHVVILGESLLWFQHDWFEVCKLLADME